MDPVTATQVRRRLADALTNIDDVALVDFNGHYTVNVVALKLALSSRIKVGYSLSVVVTEPFPPDNVQSLVEPDMQEYAALLMEGALAIRDHYIVVVPGENFEDAVEDIATQLNLRALQDYREKHR